MPNGVVTHLEARLLRELVNREIHPIRCAASCKQKYMKGMYIGDLCAETGHFGWAMKVWRLTAELIENKDYDDWIYVWFDNNRVRLRDVISETECELLRRRISELWGALGFPENAWWDDYWEHITSETFGTCYYSLFADKYNSNYFPAELQIEWEDELNAYKVQQDTEMLFREGQGDNLPPCSQDFTEYWHGGPHVEDFTGLYVKRPSSRSA